MLSPDTLDALAALDLPRGGPRPRALRLDSDGVTLTATLPAPATLAATPELFPDGESAGICRVGRSGGLTTTSGEPLSWSLHDLAARLVARLADLPDRDDAGAVYRDLRLVARESPRLATAYAVDTARAWWRTLPARSQRRERRYPKGETARKTERRERYRHQEEASSRYYLDGWRTGWDGDEEAPAPGSRAFAATLLADAVAMLSELADAEETVDDDGEIPARAPGPRRFYGVGDEVLGARRKTEDGRAYWTVPEMEDDVTLYTDEEIREAQEVREIVTRLREQRDRLGLSPRATGTDGDVVDLAQHRRHT
ncbi:hypothetical protein KUV85_00690 [Nocardioides panacisoli]|uniref:hypothetical protein n=1 Tax=Nocardioides panacisoli TaxID=627624 RepID=UPI001C62BE17|nr:hypothetical protein [Nocardioides panacisoli]QYJ04231.1 hypothetical protein KUV85_00690 [Nocardioides panacisoli]